MQFWDYFTHFQWAKSQPELWRDLKNMDAGAFHEWYFGQINARAMVSTSRRLEEIDPFTPALLSLEREWAVAGRKAFFRAYEQRMDTLVTHSIFGYRVSYRRMLEIQTRLLARVVTGELSTYPVFATR
jgi:hypothetical protein